jgi:PAS domain S-box-containing protein
MRCIPTAACLKEFDFPCPPAEAAGTGGARRDANELESLLKQIGLVIPALQTGQLGGFGFSAHITNFTQAINLLGAANCSAGCNCCCMPASPATSRPIRCCRARAARAAMMEAMAQKVECTQEELDRAFITGMFSLLDILLGMPLNDIIEPLKLPVDIVNALVSAPAGWASCSMWWSARRRPHSPAPCRPGCRRPRCRGVLPLSHPGLQLGHTRQHRGVITMISSVGTDDLACCSALLDAMQNLQGMALHAALGVASGLLKRPGGRFVVSLPAVTPDGLCQVVEHEDAQFGYFVFPALTRPYTELERTRLAMLAAFLGRLMQRRAGRQARPFAGPDRSQTGAAGPDPEPDARVGHHHGPGRFHHQLEPRRRALFGYSALEAIGRNVLFLYENEDEEDSLHDLFLEQGGREMEVRRRKKSGEVFWASLSLSVMRDQSGHPIGLIGYLNDITERKMAELIHHLAYYDALTGLPNRTCSPAPWTRR